jgi:hypothetical protein
MRALSVASLLCSKILNFTCCEAKVRFVSRAGP